MKKAILGFWIVLLIFFAVNIAIGQDYECEGIFRVDHECDKAVDGDWMTSAVPDAYGASVNIIERYCIPAEVENGLPPQKRTGS